jgi:predicted amidohydrolase YtcJ
VRVGGMKLGVDGGFEGGWMREPYAEPWGEHGTFYGVNTMKQAPYTDVVRELNRLGWRVSTHAVGDAAIDEVLTALRSRECRAIDCRQALDARARVHSAGGSVSPDESARSGHLRAESFVSGGTEPVAYWGPKRAAWTTPVRAYLDRGFVVAGGTDSAVVPYPPLWVIYHFVTRDTISGGVLGADQRISRQDALRLETINNAFLTFEERLKGSIEAGKLADLVVLPEDILTCPEKHIEQMRVVMTMVGGKIVFGRPPS